jgi:FAD/FMN-containing dehydrogenase
MRSWDSLGRRIDGDVALPGSTTYQGSRPPFNARFRDVQPSAVVACASPQDVSEAISFARRHGLELVPRAGGHSFAGHSSTRGLVVDVTPMRSVTLASGVATVGAGARLGEVYEALQAHDLAIPGGSPPTTSSGPRWCSPTAASSGATTTTTRTCSGRCAAPAPATSAS